MKVDYISDIHIDFWCRETNPQHPKFHKQLEKLISILKIPETNSEVLIIAGDLGHYNHQDKEFLLKCKQYYKKIFLVRGNHDMYLIGKQEMKYSLNWRNRAQDLKLWCNENNIDYLDGDIIEYNGKKFAGVGMSWDRSYYEYLQKRNVRNSEILEFYKNTMNDAKLILEGGENYKVPTSYGGSYLHSTFNQFNYFEEEYEKLQNIRDYDDINVMISHYVPTNPFIYGIKHYEKDLASTFYMFNGEKDIERIQPEKWIFGHMHFNYNFIHKDVNFLCNPLGYPGEDTYNVVKTFEI